MRLWWVSMSLFMELAGEKGRVGGGLLHLFYLLQLLEERHGGLVGQVHLDLHPVIDGVSVVNVKVV